MMSNTRSDGQAQAPPAQPDLYSRFEEAYEWVSGSLTELYTSALNATAPPPRTGPRIPPPDAPSAAGRRSPRERPRAAPSASRGGLADFFDGPMSESVSGFWNQIGGGDCTATNFNPRCSHEATPEDAVEPIRRNDEWDRGDPALAMRREAPFARQSSDELPNDPFDIPRSGVPRSPGSRLPEPPPAPSPASDRPLGRSPPAGLRPASSSPALAHQPLASPRQDLPRGMSSPSMPEKHTKRRPEEREVKDEVHDQVMHFLKYHPRVLQEHSFFRKHPGVYEFDGRELRVEQCERGLVVVDGPLRQPMADYMDCSERNAEYDVQGIGVDTNLHSIPREKRMSFNDTHKVYSRLEAMKVAKEQANMRERAAEYIKDGREVPKAMWDVYKNNIGRKLGEPPNRRKEREPPEVASESTPAPLAFPKPMPVQGTGTPPPTASMPYQKWPSPPQGPPGQALSTGPFGVAPPKAWPETLRYQLPAPNLFQPMTLSPPTGFPPPSQAPAVFQAQR